MRAVTYSWIGVSAAAPLIFLMSAWVLGVFHSYRRHWRSVDLFLLAVFVQELLMTLQVFVYALLSLMKPESSIACGVFVWSISATRTLQAATVTSLLVDRALTSQWPYKYRFSVRRHQIRYHLAVLATMAALVGIAAILTGDVPKSFNHCTFLPYALHVRLALFLLSVYGLLLVISVASVAVVQSTRGCFGGKNSITPDLSSITHGTNSSSSSSGRVLTGRPLHPATSNASTTSSNASSGHMGGMQAASSTTDLVPPPPPHRPPIAQCKNSKLFKNNGLPSTADFRWGTTLSVVGLCFLVNHLPYLGLTVLGTFLPQYLPRWPSDNIALWLSLTEGLLLPLVLGIADATFSKAAGSSCVRETKRQPPSSRYEDGEGPFRLFPKDEIKSFPLTNGSLFSSLLNMSVDSPQVMIPSYKREQQGVSALRLGVTHEIRGLVGAVGRDRLKDTYGGSFGGQSFYNSENTASTASTTTSRDNYGGQGYYLRGANTASTMSTTTSQDPIYCDPLSKGCDNNDSLKSEDHIYATLSETFGSLSSLSDDYLGGHERCSSVTTIANDDFVFHDPRINMTHGQSNMPQFCHYPSSGPESTLSLSSRPPAELPVIQSSLSHSSSSSSSTASAVSSFRSTSSDESSTIEITRKNINNKTMSIEDINDLSSIYHHDYKYDSMEKKRYVLQRAKEEVLEDVIEEHADKMSDIVSDYKVDVSNTGTLSKKNRCSSLSLNDLDRIDSSDSQSDDQMMFILPMKSESMLSLYRLYLAEDENHGGKSLHYSFEVSRSDGDLTVAHNNSKHDKKDSSSKTSLTSGKSEGALFEVYQKRKPSLETGGSKIRRQHKIQRAKVVQKRTKNTNNQNQSTTASLTDSRISLNNPSTGDTIEVQQRGCGEGLQVAVMDKSRKRNGIITIQDPSVLSVEELFNVLNRASGHSTSESNGTSGSSSSDSSVNSETTNTEYKKIFVSEYL